MSPPKPHHDDIRFQGIDPEKAESIANDLANSEIAVDILGNIWDKQENYTSQIARDLDKSQTSIDRLVRKMAKADILEISKQGRSKYYRINRQGLANFIVNTVAFKFYTKNEDYVAEDTAHIDLTSIGYATIRIYLEVYLSFYFDEYDHKQDKTFRQLLFFDFISIFEQMILKEDLDPEMEEKYLKEFVILYTSAFSSPFVDKALERFHPDRLFSEDDDSENKVKKKSLE